MTEHQSADSVRSPLASHRVWHNLRECHVYVCENCVERIERGDEGEAFYANKPEPLTPRELAAGMRRCLFIRHPRRRGGPWMGAQIDGSVRHD